jgi:hypothetical protein
MPVATKSTFVSDTILGNCYISPDRQVVGDHSARRPAVSQGTLQQEAKLPPLTDMDANPRGVDFSFRVVIELPYPPPVEGGG